MRIARKADLIIIIGTSLIVTPANFIPVETLNNGGKIIILNLTKTYLDEKAYLTFNYDFKKIIPELSRILF